MRLLSIAAAFAALAPGGASAGATPHTYANPIDLDYRYNFEQINSGVSYRTGADPAIVNFNGAYYLFLTLADGYWRSTDLINWRFVKPSRWPFHSMVAPAAWADGEKLVLMPAMMKPGSILETTAPDTGKLDFLVRRMPPLPGSVDKPSAAMKPGEVPPGPWDPALFKDDDGQWYLYWDSSNVFPIYGQKIAFDDRRLVYETRPEPLIALNPDEHGWERFGRDHDGKDAAGQAVDPYIEGAWMTKVNGRYYLQYAAPGTEFNVYANGAYVGDQPLGPFTYAPWNPVSYKPGGFVVGAGHGSTFQDNYGNWWNSGTPWVGYNWKFERRVAIFPTRFWPDGQMAASTRFGDFPHYVPRRRVKDPESLFTGWMLLSYKKPATASSTLGEFAASHVTDDNYQTFWVARDNKPGETLTIDLGSVQTLRAIQVDFADYKSARFADAPDIYADFHLEASEDGKSWREIARTKPPRRDRPNAYFELPRPVRARFVRYAHGHVGAAHLAIAEIRIFGNAGGAAPPAPARIDARREADARNAHIQWSASAGAIGYNVRWGVRPDRLTFTYQKFADQLADPSHPALELTSLNKGAPYYVAVEAFNASGVSKLSPIRRISADSDEARRSGL
ncbi:MAG: family 43 glycosylhydrolase [Alphaproteobacteria bacterium]|nr:family 43 glycosylhydrolase [Alphaproteobacteria bacterium]